MRTPSPFLSVPSTAGALARLVCAKLRSAGRDLGPILSEAGLKVEQIDNPKIRLEARAQVKLLEIAANELQDDLLGYHLAREFEPREVGLLHYVLASCGNLADSLSRAERYTRIIDEGIGLKFKVEQAAVVALNYVDVERPLDRQHIEFWLFGIVRVCRIFTDTRLAPLRVKARHVRDATPAEFRSFLGCDMDFGADVDEIIFPRPVATLPFANADEHLNRLLTEYAEDALAHRTPNKAHIRSRVEKAIATLLPHDKARASEVARQLGLSPRTLSRLLSAEGLSFSAILEKFRRDLAKTYLNDPAVSISEIAWLLGYREVSTFTHAFRRWTGMTPRQLRAAS
jgi:AraC-like DNA-binding protein